MLRFERRLGHPVERVWRALSEPGELAGWFPAVMEGERVRGGKVRFVFPGGEEVLEGEILECDPPRVFAYTWGDSVLRWELQPEDGGCVLRFSHTFDERPFAASFATGWHRCLDALDGVLLGRGAPAQASAEVAASRSYRVRHEAYAEVFGLLAGTVEEDDGRWVVRFARLVPYPREQVWAALTGGAQPVVSDAAPVATTAGHAEAVTEATEPAVLAFRAGDGEVRWTLSPGPGGTLVELSQPVTAAKRSAALAGWRARLERLAAELASAADQATNQAADQPAG